MFVAVVTGFVAGVNNTRVVVEIKSSLHQQVPFNPDTIICVRILQDLSVSAQDVIDPSYKMHGSDMSPVMIIIPALGFAEFLVDPAYHKPATFDASAVIHWLKRLSET